MIYAATNLGNKCQLKIYVYMYRIYELGAGCKLESFCAPFGVRVGEYKFVAIYICIRYMLPTILVIYVNQIYILVLNISCQ